MSFTFKDYEDSDWEDLKEMALCLYEEDPLGAIMTEEKIRKTVCESLSHPDKLRIIMIRTDGKNIGYGIIVFFWSNEYGGDIIDIDELFVKKEYRNRQAATSFINHQAAYKSAVALSLEATPLNDSAIKLYKKMGFEPSQNYHMLLHLNDSYH